jgi:hypothetical protein
MGKNIKFTTLSVNDIETAAVLEHQGIHCALMANDDLSEREYFYMDEPEVRLALEEHRRGLLKVDPVELMDEIIKLAERFKEAMHHMQTE